MKLERTPLVLSEVRDEQLRRQDRAQRQGAEPSHAGRLIREQMRALGHSPLMRERIQAVHDANLHHDKTEREYRNAINDRHDYGTPVPSSAPSKEDLATAKKRKADALKAIREGADQSGTTIAQHHPFTGDPKSWEDRSDHFYKTAHLYGAAIRGGMVKTRPGLRPQTTNSDEKPGELGSHHFMNKQDAEKFAREYHPHIKDEFHPGRVRTHRARPQLGQDTIPATPPKFTASFLTKTTDAKHYGL